MANNFDNNLEDKRPNSEEQQSENANDDIAQPETEDEHLSSQAPTPSQNKRKPAAPPRKKKVQTRKKQGKKNEPVASDDNKVAKGAPNLFGGTLDNSTEDSPAEINDNSVVGALEDTAYSLKNVPAVAPVLSTKRDNEIENGAAVASKSTEPADMYEDSCAPCDEHDGTAQKGSSRRNRRKAKKVDGEDELPPPAASRRPTTRTRNKAGTGTGRRAPRSMNRCPMSDAVSVAASNIYDRVKKRKRREVLGPERVHHGSVRKIKRINSHQELSMASGGQFAIEGDFDEEEVAVGDAAEMDEGEEGHEQDESSLTAEEANGGAVEARSSEGSSDDFGSPEEFGDLFIEVKREVKLENDGDDTDDTKSYLDDEDDVGDALGDPDGSSGVEGQAAVDAPGAEFSSYLHSKKWVKTTRPTGETVLISENDFSSLSGSSKEGDYNVDVKPNMAEISESNYPISNAGSTDQQSIGNAASGSGFDPNSIVTLCYFCLSETVFFDGSLDNFRSHLWEHLNEYDVNENCPLDCEETFDGNVRELAIHFFEKHQYLPTVSCPKCCVKLLYDNELITHNCTL